jgi:hypothetical protein
MIIYFETVENNWLQTNNLIDFFSGITYQMRANNAPLLFEQSTTLCSIIRKFVGKN